MKLPSKRVIARLAVLSLVVVLGGFAIAQAHLALKRSDSGEDGQGTASAAEANKPPKREIQTIPLTAAPTETPPRSNPFPESRLLPAGYEVAQAGSPADSPAEASDPRDMRFRSSSPAASPAKLAPAAAAAIGDSSSPAAAATEGHSPDRDSGFAAPPPPRMSDTYVPPSDALPEGSPTADRPGAFKGRSSLRSPAAMTAAGAAAGTATDGTAIIHDAMPSDDGQSRTEPTAAPPPGLRRQFGESGLPAADTEAPPAEGEGYGRYGRGAAANRAADSRLSVGDTAADPGSALPRAGLGAATLPRSDSGGLSIGSDDRVAGDSRLSRTATSAEGVGTPGDPKLEGPQTPSIVVEKAAPSEIQVGKPARFALKVRNAGPVAARELVVRDQIPKGTRLIDTSPAATRVVGSDVFWELDVLEPNQEKMVAMEVMPVAEGEIGSVASVTFAAHASARTIATRPELAVEHSAPRKVLVGSPVAFSIKLSNPGTGAATGVILEENVPEGLIHPAGNELEFEVGTLLPGETRELELTLTANKAGIIENLLTCRADANLVAEHRTSLEVIAPELRLSMEGPRRRYLERPAVYDITVLNPGTAPAHEVEMTAYLPKGMRYLETNNAGAYDAERHTVSWSIAELPPQRSGSVKLTVMPLEDGEQKIRVEGRADMELVDLAEQTVMVEGLASLFFEVADSADPIEVGKETMYEIRVLNEGSKTATNVRVVAELPQQLKPLNGDGPTRGVVQGQSVAFEPLTRLAPKADALYKVRIQGLTDGDHRIRVQILSDEMQTPVTREESTLVYADR